MFVNSWAEQIEISEACGSLICGPKVSLLSPGQGKLVNIHHYNYHKCLVRRTTILFDSTHLTRPYSNGVIAAFLRLNRVEAAESQSNFAYHDFIALYFTGFLLFVI